MTNSPDKTQKPKKTYTRPLADLGGARPPAPDWFEAAIAAPCEEGEVEVRGATIRYTAWGDRGKPGLMFVHGGRAHRNWWRPFAPFFSADWRVAALDLSGMGDSDWREEYSLEAFCEELFAVIAAAGLDEVRRPLVVGHSFGGYVTLAAVERHGERLGGAVVIDSPLGLPDPTEGYTIGEPSDGKAEKERKFRIYDTLEEPLARFRFLPDQPADHLYLVDFIARHGIKKVTEDGKTGWIWKFDPHKSGGATIHFERDLLRAARCPLAFIYGEKSKLAQGESIAHLMEQARGRSPFILMPEAHHHLMMDQPMAFVSTMRTLLSCWPVRVGG